MPFEFQFKPTKQFAKFQFKPTKQFGGLVYKEVDQEETVMWAYFEGK